MAAFELRPIQASDRDWVDSMAVKEWGAEMVVSRGRVYRLSDLPGFVAEIDGESVGLATYYVEGYACELMSINSWRENLGIGAALIDAVKEAARQADCDKLWVITTNDNTGALRFYQRRGFYLTALYPNAIDESRRLKPQIPLLGYHDIPIRDEIELEIKL